MNVVICRVRVFDFSKPLQGTSPTLIGQGWYRKKGILYYIKPKKASGKRKKSRVEKRESMVEEKGRQIKTLFVGYETKPTGLSWGTSGKIEWILFSWGLFFCIVFPSKFILEIQTEFLGTSTAAACRSGKYGIDQIKQDTVEKKFKLNRNGTGVNVKCILCWLTCNWIIIHRVLCKYDGLRSGCGDEFRGNVVSFPNERYKDQTRGRKILLQWKVVDKGKLRV